MTMRGWSRSAQVALVISMSCALGSLMQLVKLSSVDAAGRQFSQTSHFSKQSFLTAYGILKACANLALGWWVSSPSDVKWGGLAGWLLALMVLVLAALAKTWTTVVLANAFLGFQQGLAWTCTVLLIVPLFKADQRGLALGLNEAMGYTCLAAMAPVYGQLERWMVGCSWAGADEVSPECLSASQSTCASPDSWVPECVGQCTCGSYTGLVARVGGVIVATGLGLCIVLISLQLFGPAEDSDSPQGESKGNPAIRGVSGYSMVGRPETDVEVVAAGPQKHPLLGSGLANGTAGYGRDGGEVELGVAPSNGGGDWEGLGQAERGSAGHRMVNEETGMRPWGVVARETPKMVAGVPGKALRVRYGDVEVEEVAVKASVGDRHGGAGVEQEKEEEEAAAAGIREWGHHSGAKTDGLVGAGAEADGLQGHYASDGTFELLGHCPGGRATQHLQVAPVSKTAAFLRFTLGLGNEDVKPTTGLAWGRGSSTGVRDGDRGGGLQGWGEAGGDKLGSDRAMGRWGRMGRLLRELVTRSARAGGDSARAQEQEGGQGLLEGAGHVNGGLGLAPRACSKKGGRSTLILCVAGMACNMVASLAWGMLLSWARDLLLIPGPGRDLMASTYQFVMAATLLLAAHTSDHTGRTWWVVGGLCCSAAGLLTAACGAGFQGQLLLGVPTAPAALIAGNAEQHSLQLLQYGYLQLASCLLGMGTGFMYGTMAAAVVDHSYPSNQAINMATFRFWRDLGYALGSFAGLAADASSTEVSMLVFGAICLVIASSVAIWYQEAGGVEKPMTVQPSIDAALAETDNEEEVQRQSLLGRQSNMA